jgi:hypothetical protein
MSLKGKIKKLGKKTQKAFGLKGGTKAKSAGGGKKSIGIGRKGGKVSHKKGWKWYAREIRRLRMKKKYDRIKNRF